MSQTMKLTLQPCNCISNIQRVLCLLILKGSTTQNKKIKKTSSSFSVILLHTDNTKYRVKCEVFRAIFFYLKKKKKIKSPSSSYFSKTQTRNMFYLLLGLYYRMTLIWMRLKLILFQMNLVSLESLFKMFSFFFFFFSM